MAPSCPPSCADEAPLRTCENCDGEGGYETATFPPSKWDDPTPGGEWIACKYCDGLGWEEGEPLPLAEDDLPPPHGDL
jgi:hypothetical protein